MFLARTIIFNFFLLHSQLEIAAFVHERRGMKIVVHRTLLDSMNGLYQVQQYSSALTSSSRQPKCYFHIVHYVAEDLSGGHFAMLRLHESGSNTNYASDES